MTNSVLLFFLALVELTVSVDMNSLVVPSKPMDKIGHFVWFSQDASSTCCLALCNIFNAHPESVAEFVAELH